MRARVVFILYCLEHIDINKYLCIHKSITNDNIIMFKLQATLSNGKCQTNITQYYIVKIAKLGYACIQ